MQYAKNILKSELALRRISHQELASRLNEAGYDETKASIDNKLSRGTFSADFFLVSLFVIGVPELELCKIKQIVGKTDEISS
ncbi:DUF6471 domain-containing protein [Shewanella sp. HL-SH8]|uniref:DUF6471 domain-containing protein n=1 Tax=Shewanella sp. HL-SH8 TaxID=3436242 RepID=UPI003EB79F01